MNLGINLGSLTENINKVLSTEAPPISLAELIENMKTVLHSREIIQIMLNKELSKKFKEEIRKI